MKQGYLSQYFSGVASKELSAVEADSGASNQHEFNGVNSLRRLFGESRRKFNAKFLYLNDDDEPITDQGFLTWYNSREGKPRSAEYRLYFPKTSVSKKARAGDTLILGLQPDDIILTIITEKGSTIEQQIKWLFALGDDVSRFSVRDNLDEERDRVVLVSSLVLEQIGIEADLYEDSYLEEMLEKFNSQFPSTKEFSSYARSTLPDVSVSDSSDGALWAWINREEALFKTLERHLVQRRLTEGFEEDVDGFIRYSLSVHNRRKSRVGYALENHLEEVWHNHGITYSRGQVTENRSKPDFVFPSIASYRDTCFDTNLLTVLGAKSTCKDRWRQVLAEADRVENKHLLTLEHAISENQTSEMQDKKLQLVVPRALHETFTLSQQKWLMDLGSFIELVLDKQERGRSAG